MDDTRLDDERIAGHTENGLMRVTSRSPSIGHQETACICGPAAAQATIRREAAPRAGCVDEATFDQIPDPGTTVDWGVCGA